MYFKYLREYLSKISGDAFLRWPRSVYFAKEGNFLSHKETFYPSVDHKHRTPRDALFSVEWDEKV